MHDINKLITCVVNKYQKHLFTDVNKNKKRHYCSISPASARTYLNELKGQLQISLLILTLLVDIRH